MNHYIFLVDYSYSMNCNISKIIDVINKFLDKIKEVNQSSLFTIASFSDELSWIYKGINTSYIYKINLENFKNPGCTSLYDSVSSIILEFAYLQPNIKNIFYIITDGDDNCSKKYNRQTTDDLCAKAISNGWIIKHFDTTTYITLSVPTIKFDMDDMSELFDTMNI